MKLKPFQEEGRDFLASKRCALLADQMRLGKTGQALRAAVEVFADTVLVVCPAVAITMWEQACASWLIYGLAEFKVVSYDYVRNHNGQVDSGFGGKWDVLILDESHFLKSTDAARTKAVLGKGGLVWNARRVWAMSGTPAPNHAGELWPLLKVFGATRMTEEHFIARYCQLDPFSQKVLGNKKDNLAELRGILETVMLRRTKKQVAPELPDCTVTSYPVRPDPSMLDLAWPVGYEERYGKMKQLELKLKRDLVKPGVGDEHMLDVLDGLVDELATLRRVTSLLKVPALLELLQFELDSDIIKKCVVFGYHVEALKVARSMLHNRGYKVDMLYGGTPKKKREAIFTRFDRDKGGTQVLFAQMIAAGTAIDLSAAHEGFMLEWDWVPGNNAQALERMGGYRQTLPITIRDIRIPGSIDDIVTRVVRRKAAALADIYIED